MFDRKEQQIREQRTNEAMINGYMGAEGKFSRIARVLGEPVIRQGSSNYEQHFLYDPLAVEEDMPTADEDQYNEYVGQHFDGLRRGYHLEVLWLDDLRELKVYAGGHLVYREVGGELHGYVPGEWEKEAEVLFQLTRKKERRDRKERAKVVEVQAKSAQQQFLEAMRKKWGL